MKKLLTISFALLCLAFNAGVLVNLHFCGTAFHHITLITGPKDCCEGENSCCHNTSCELKIIGDYDNLISSPIAAHVQFEIEPLVTYGTNPVLSDDLRQEETFHSPGPLIQTRKHPLYLTNRVLII